MNAPILSYQFAPASPATFSELDAVRLLSAVTTDEGDEVPAGTCGTIVAVWGGGDAYEVEVEAGLATVEASQLAAA